MPVFKNASIGTIIIVMSIIAFGPSLLRSSHNEDAKKTASVSQTFANEKNTKTPEAVGLKSEINLKEAERQPRPRPEEAEKQMKEIQAGLPGIKWGTTEKEARRLKVFTLQFCGEKGNKYEPTFYSIVNPNRYQVLGVPSSKGTFYLKPALWFYQGELLGIQLDFSDVEAAYKNLISILGPEQKNNGRIRRWLSGRIHVKFHSLPNDHGIVFITDNKVRSKLLSVRQHFGRSSDMWD